MLKFIERDSIKIALICVILCLSSVTDARKAAGAKRGGGSKYGSSSRVSKPAQTQQQSAPSYANPSQLSYGPGQQPAPRPSAPVDSSANKPIGWNVGHETPAVAANKPPVNSAPYPTNNNQFPQAPPPSYSQYPNAHGNVNGPPPPYSAQPQPGLQSRFNEPPPAYSPHQPNPGYPVQQQPGLGQPGAYPVQGGYPMPQGQPGFVPGAGQPPTIVNNYHQVPQQGGGGGGLSGLQTGLLAGTAGLALYGALKPSDTKTVIINNTVIQEVPANHTEMAANATHVESTPVPLASYPPTGSPGSSEMIPLAPYPSSTLYPALPSEAVPTCNGTDCPTPMVLPVSSAPQVSSSEAPGSSVASNQSPSSLAPLTTFAAMANDAATNNMASPPSTNPTMASAPTSSVASSLPSQVAPMSNDLQQPSALNSSNSNNEKENQRDSGSSTVKMSFVSLIVLPLVWVSVY